MNTNFIVTGLNGERKLKGEFRINGAKNETTPAMALSVLFQDGLFINNAPQVEDVKRLSEVLKKIGIKVIFGENTIDIKTSKINSCQIDKKLGKMMRSSVILTGSILARMGKVEFSFPGGCNIGERPIDLFLEAYKKMGAKVSYEKGNFTIKAKKLKGADIFFKVQSVTATETIVMAAVLARGKTVLRNCAMEPEIENQLNFLVKAGVKIKGIGSPTLEIMGRDGVLLKNNKVGNKKNPYQILPDRIEAGSILILAALAAKDVTITHCNPLHLEALTDALKRANVKMEIGKNYFRIKNQKNKNFRGIKIKTHEYPGFPTDLQSQIGVFMTQVRGHSQIQETIFGGRLEYLKELKKMKADIISWDSSKAHINGPRNLDGRKLNSPDLRGGFAFLIAAVVAKGISHIGSAYYIKRGYADIVTRLQKIGVNIEAVKYKQNKPFINFKKAKKIIAENITFLKNKIK